MHEPLEWDLQRELKSLGWRLSYKMFHDDYGPKVFSKDIGRGGAVVSFVSPKSVIVVDLTIVTYVRNGGGPRLEVHSEAEASSIKELEEFIEDRIDAMSNGGPLPDVASLIARGTPIR